MYTERFHFMGDVWERQTRNRYVAHVKLGTMEWEAEPRDARELRDLAAKHPDLVSVTYLNRRYVAVYPLCAFCGSRPQTQEWDCDGLHYTSTCEDEQCQHGDVRRGSRNISASNRARGFDS